MIARMLKKNYTCGSTSADPLDPQPRVALVLNLEGDEVKVGAKERGAGQPPEVRPPAALGGLGLADSLIAVGLG